MKIEMVDEMLSFPLLGIAGRWRYFGVVTAISCRLHQLDTVLGQSLWQTL